MIILRNQLEIRFLVIVKGLLRFIMPVFFIITSFVIFSSCSSKERVPEGVLTKDQMVNVLIELHIAEEKVNQLKLPIDSSKTLAAVMKDKVLEKTNVEDTVFEDSFNYYLDRPKEMEQIYTAIVDSLQLREQRAPQDKNSP